MYMNKMLSISLSRSLSLTLYIYIYSIQHIHPQLQPNARYCIAILHSALRTCLIDKLMLHRHVPLLKSGLSMLVHEHLPQGLGLLTRPN